MQKTVTTPLSRGKNKQLTHKTGATMITQALKDAVKAEADLLKQHATAKQIARLDIKKLKANDSKGCIYGLMTGECYNSSAARLLNICAKPYSDNPFHFIEPSSGYFPKEDRQYEAHSAIEFYILQYGAQNANLIAYLKGETDTLEL